MRSIRPHNNTRSLAKIMHCAPDHFITQLPAAAGYATKVICAVPWVESDVTTLSEMFLECLSTLYLIALKSHIPAE